MNDGLSDDERARLSARLDELAKPAAPTQPTADDMFREEYRALVDKYGKGINSCSCCGIWVSDEPDTEAHMRELS